MNAVIVMVMAQKNAGMAVMNVIQQIVQISQAAV